MAVKLGKYQHMGFSSWGKLTENNHLGSIFRLEPQKATNLMVKLLAFYQGKTLDTFLNEFPVKEFEDDREYYWDVVASSYMNIPLVEARDENGNVVTAESGNVGAGTTPFYLVFAKDWFYRGNIIVGNLNQVYQFLIKEEARLEGTNAVYKVELAGGNTDGCPAERLLAGERFSIEFSPVEESLSRGVGGAHYTAPVSMRNEFTHIRTFTKVGGGMLDKKIAFGIPLVEDDGNKGTPIIENRWMHVVDWELEQEFSREKNNAIAFGRSNRNSNNEYMNMGVSGKPIRTGAGLFEQMEVSNVIYYNSFDLKLLTSALSDISTAKLNFNDRFFVLKTGEWGAAQFNEAVLTTTSGWTQFLVDNSSVKIVEKVQSKLHTNALSTGYQFVQYKAPNGVILKVDVDPMYDDPVRNKIMHPLGGPAMSRRYDLFYMGSSDQPNIMKCIIKGRPEYRGYRWGLRNPFTGQRDNPNMSYDEDSAEIHRMATLGVAVLDPTRTLSMIPSILEG